MKISQVGQIKCVMGEGPIWDSEQQRLYFTDVFGKKLLRYTPDGDQVEHWDMPDTISALALRKDGVSAIVAMSSGLYKMDLASGALTFIVDPTKDEPTGQLNDGRVDRAGRFVIGSVDTRGGTSGKLYSVAVDGSVRELDRDFGITNGACWSPDGATFYLADSVKKVIYAYDYDQATGDVANRRVFADTSAIPGIPDGASVDTQGRLWTAMCDGAQVVAFDANGRLVQSIEMPTGFIAAVAFGGAALDRLYVTTMDASRLADLLAAQGAQHGPDAIGGALFVIDGLDAKGLPTERFGG